MRNHLDNPALPIVMYLGVIGVLGVLSGGSAPDTVTHGTPVWLTHMWAWSLALGGVLATVACLTGRTRGESAGLAMLVFGLGLYGLAEVAAGGPVEGLETATALVALIGCCAIRMRVLHLARRAQRKAQRILRREVPPWTS